MAFDKLKALAEKCGHTHLSLEFLMEFKECVPEFEQFMRDGRALFAPVDPPGLGMEQDNEIEILEKCDFPYGDLIVDEHDGAPYQIYENTEEGAELVDTPDFFTIDEAYRWMYDHTSFPPGTLDICGDGIAPDGTWSVHFRDGREVKPGPLTFEEAQKWVDDHTGE